MTPILLALSILAAAPGAAPPPAAADPAIAEVSAQVDAMMGEFKGKPLADLVRRLGPVESSRAASDGQVVYWRARTEPTTKCGMTTAGGFACAPVAGKECLLAVALNLQSNVVAWKLTGEVDACRNFLKPPPPPAA